MAPPALSLYMDRASIPMELIAAPNELLVVDKDQVVERIKTTPKSFDEDLRVARKRKEVSDIKTKKINKFVSFTGKSEVDYLAALRVFATKLTEERIFRTVGRDALVVQAIDSIEDLNKQINQFVSRLREWHALIDPQNAMELEDHEKFVKLAAEHVDRTLFGMEVGEQDKATISSIAQSILGLYQLKSRLEKYVDRVMDEIAPNVKSLTGSLLGAKLIAKAGGLYRLAIMPGSTIQVIGAEKALFRHLIKGTSSPKHGIIFQHPMVSGKPKDVRGRIARSLASKIAIAARMDYYHHGLDNSLAEDFDRRVREVSK